MKENGTNVAVVESTFQLKQSARCFKIRVIKELERYICMMESDVKIYDSNINLRSVDVKKINPAINSAFEAAAVTSRFEGVRNNCDLRFAKKRKFRRVKSAGIF